MKGGLEVCTFAVEDQWFGIDALEVQEIMPSQRIARVPLTAPAIAGLLNVRGELVTAIDLRRLLALPPRSGLEASMNIVLRTAEGAVSLLVDAVGEVIEVNENAREPAPPSLREAARALVETVVKRPECLLLRLNTQALLRACSSGLAEPARPSNL